MSFAHIIFDLDGTLLDTIPELLFNLDEAFAHLGLNGHFTKEEVASFIGSGKDEQVRRALRSRHLGEEYFKAVNSRLSTNYTNNNISKTAVFPQVQEVLDALKEKKIKLYVATNKPHNVALEVVKHFFPNTFLLVRGDKGDGILKPNPEFLGLVLDFINDAKENILFVGDSNIDYLSAKNVGIKCAIVPHGYDKQVLTIKDDKLIVLNNFTDLLVIN